MRITILCNLCLFVLLFAEAGLLAQSTGENHFYRHLKGKLGTKNITWEWHQLPETMSVKMYQTTVVMWVEGAATPYYLRGNGLQAMGDSLYLKEYHTLLMDEAEPKAHWKLRWNAVNNTMIGERIPTDLPKPQEVSLREQYPKGVLRMEPEWLMRRSNNEQSKAVASIWGLEVRSGSKKAQMRINAWLQDSLYQQASVFMNGFIQNYENDAALGLTQTHEEAYKKIRITHNTDQTLSVLLERFISHGLGQPEYQLSAYIFDSHTGELIPPQALFLPQTEDTLGRLLAQTLRQVAKVPPSLSLADYGFIAPDERLPVSQNIILVGEGLCFIYNPYEISSAAAGTITLYLPYKQLKGLIHTAKVPKFR